MDKQSTVKCRESNFDILRVISAIAVIVIHITAIYRSALISGDSFGNYHTDSLLAILLYDTLTRFAVPCFMMLSGAFLLADDRNMNFKYFYKKSLKNVVIQMVIFSLVFLGYFEFKNLYSVITEGGGFSKLLIPVVNTLMGRPCSHMWYLYTLTGIYLLIPFVLKIKNSISEKAFGMISLIYFVVAVLSGWTSSFRLEWGIGKVACYLGFVLVGYQLRNICSVKNNLQGILLVIAGFLSQLLLVYVQYRHILGGITEENEKFSLTSYFNPVVAFASVLIFAGFSKLNIKNCRLGNLPKLTFYIYILHMLVIDAVNAAVFKIFGFLPKAEIFIPISLAIVFILSYILALLYNKIWNIADRKLSITDKACKLLKLN